MILRRSIVLLLLILPFVVTASNDGDTKKAFLSRLWKKKQTESTSVSYSGKTGLLSENQINNLKQTLESNGTGFPLSIYVFDEFEVSLHDGKSYGLEVEESQLLSKEQKEQLIQAKFGSFLDKKANEFAGSQPQILLGIAEFTTVESVDGKQEKITGFVVHVATKGIEATIEENIQKRLIDEQPEISRETFYSNLLELIEISKGAFNGIETEFEKPWVLFGAIDVEFAEDAVLKKTEVDGIDEYEQVNCSVEIPIKYNDVVYDLSIPDAFITFKTKENLLEAIDFTIEWSGEVELPELFFLGTTINKVLIRKVNETDVSGELVFNSKLLEDLKLGAIVLKKDFNMDVSYSFDKNLLSGSMEIEALQNANFEVKMDEKIIQSGSFTKIGRDQLKFESKLETELNFSASNLSYELKRLEFDCEIPLSYTLNNSIQWTSFAASMNVSGLPNLEGKVSSDFQYTDGTLKGVVTSEELKFFNLQMSNLKLNAQLGNDFQINLLKGAFEVSHDEFNSNLKVNNFEFKNGEITFIQAEGEVIFEKAGIKISNGSYDSENSRIVMDASFDATIGGSKSKIKFNQLYIDSEGVISFDEVEASGEYTFGPLKLEIQGKMNKVKDGDYNSIEADCNFLLEIEDPKNSSKKISQKISRAKVSFMELRKNKPELPEFKEIHIVWEGGLEWSGVTQFTTVLKKIEINMDEDFKLSGSISMDASLNEDMELTSMILLKKGLEGSIEYSIPEGESLAGELDFSKVKNINLLFHKGDNNLAKFDHGRMNRKGTVSGKFTLLSEEVKLENTYFNIALKELELDAVLNFTTEEFEVSNGKGQVVVSDVQGMNGEITLGFISSNEAYEVVTNLDNAGVNFGSLEIEALAITAKMDLEFNITEFNGSGNLKWGENADLTFTDLLIKEGEVKSLKIKGNTEFNSFKIAVSEGSYSPQKTSLSAKISMDLGGAPQWLAVDKFDIFFDGKVEIGSIAGSISKGPMGVEFKASYSESRFKGTFDANLSRLIKFDGQVDIGTKVTSTRTYNYGYFELNVGAKIPVFPGIFINELGGKFGYNYYLEFEKGIVKKQYPRYGNYIIGLKMSVGDALDKIKLSGEPTVQFSENSFELNLTGTLSIPADNPMFLGNANINYKLPENDFKGSVSVNFKVPSKNTSLLTAGSILNVDDLSISTRLNDKEVYVSGNLTQAALFGGLAEFSGTMTYREDKQTNKYEASISGRVFAGFEERFKFNPIIGVSVDGGAELSFEANSTLAFNQDGIRNASIGGRIMGAADLTIDSPIGSAHVAASIDAGASIQYNQKKYLLKSNVKIHFEASIDVLIAEYSYEGDYDYKLVYEI